MPIARASVSMRNGRNQDGFSSDEIRHVIGENGTIHFSPAAQSFPPEKGISRNPLDHMGHFSTKPHAQACLPRFIKECSFPKLVTRFRKKLVLRRFSFSSSPANTCELGILTDRPASYFRIRSWTSASHSLSTCASGTGSTLARIRWARVNRWSWERCRASDAMVSTDAFIKYADLFHYGGKRGQTLMSVVR